MLLAAALAGGASGCSELAERNEIRIFPVVTQATEPGSGPAKEPTATDAPKLGPVQLPAGARVAQPGG